MDDYMDIWIKLMAYSNNLAVLLNSGLYINQLLYCIVFISLITNKLTYVYVGWILEENTS